MLPDFDKNAAYIWACFALGAASIALTIVIVTFRARAAKAAMAKAEARLRDGASQ